MTKVSKNLGLGECSTVERIARDADRARIRKIIESDNGDYDRGIDPKVFNRPLNEVIKPKAKFNRTQLIEKLQELISESVKEEAKTLFDDKIEHVTLFTFQEFPKHQFEVHIKGYCTIKQCVGGSYEDYDFEEIGEYEPMTIEEIIIESVYRVVNEFEFAIPCYNLHEAIQNSVKPFML